MAPTHRTGDDQAMQVLSARPGQGRSQQLSMLVGLLVGVLLIGLGLAVGYLEIATPFAQRFIPAARATPSVVLASVLGWSLLLVAPATAAVAGAAWLERSVGRGFRIRARRHPIAKLSRTLGSEYTAAAGVRLPDGRGISELIVGPHGVAVFETLPSADVLRHRDGRWELRVARNRWVPVRESPLERTVRTAESLRAWLGADDRDFLVKVHPAVIAPDDSVPRTAGCAVITRAQVAAYLQSLPVQRSFTPERRGQVVDLLRSAV